MTDIEKKALALVNEVRAAWGRHRTNVFIRGDDDKIEALCRAIEQHEAYKREVSDAVERVFDECEEHIPFAPKQKLRSFIIAKPDPLVEAMQDWWDTDGYASIETFRAAIEARGGRIVWEGE